MESELERARGHYQLAREEARAERDSAIAAANQAAEEAIERIEARYREIDEAFIDEETERIIEMLRRPPGEAGTVAGAPRRRRATSRRQGRGWAAEGAAHLSISSLHRLPGTCVLMCPTSCLFRDGDDPYALWGTHHIGSSAGPPVGCQYGPAQPAQVRHIVPSRPQAPAAASGAAVAGAGAG